MAAKKRAATAARGRRRKVAGVSLGLAPEELFGGAKPEGLVALQHAVERDGGKIIGAYREPYAGHWVALAALPIDVVEPTPFQRNLSAAHARRLETVIAKLGHFLDPIIAVPAQTSDGGVRYWTPNGFHRLAAMRSLGAKSITALVLPDTSVAYKILALNTEKAHNLRERALEVVRMYRELARIADETEESYALEFEEAALITLGLCYEQRPRFSGGAYHPILRRVDAFLKRPLSVAMQARERRANLLLELDDVVVQQVAALKEKGLTSPYLKSFVVARVNPIRFRPKDAAPLSFEETLERMTRGARKFNPAKIRGEDLARSGGPPEEIEAD
jgi:ParB family chromosome partitioning protein